MKRQAFVIAATLACLAGPAWGQSTERMGDSELQALRGGISTPLGLEIGFAASMRTLIDGTLVLETRLVWTPSGLQTQSVTGALQSGVSMGGDALSALGQRTRIIHDLTENRVASVVINTDSNRTIRQETDITLHLPQLPQMQQQMALDRMASTLQNAVSAALSDSANR